MIDFTCVTRFNFTFAIEGGAWLQDARGNRDWVSQKLIEKHLGAEWYAKQLKRQGWMTGCWVDVV